MIVDWAIVCRQVKSYFKGGVVQILLELFVNQCVICVIRYECKYTIHVKCLCDYMVIMYYLENVINICYMC